jgi:hypothetical protein
VFQPVTKVLDGKRYSPVGYCIYCQATDELTNEHIFALWAQWDSRIAEVILQGLREDYGTTRVGTPSWPDEASPHVSCVALANTV